MGPVEVSQAAKQIWRFWSQLSRGVWGSPAIFDVIPTTLPHLKGSWRGRQTEGRPCARARPQQRALHRSDGPRATTASAL